VSLGLWWLWICRFCFLVAHSVVRRGVALKELRGGVGTKVGVSAETCGLI